MEQLDLTRNHVAETHWAHAYSPAVAFADIALTPLEIFVPSHLPHRRIFACCASSVGSIAWTVAAEVEFVLQAMLNNAVEFQTVLYYRRKQNFGVEDVEYRAGFGPKGSDTGQASNAGLRLVGAFPSVPADALLSPIHANFVAESIRIRTVSGNPMFGNFTFFLGCLSDNSI
jgi:hypothetical protein